MALEVDVEDDEEAVCSEPRGLQMSTGKVFTALRCGYFSANLVFK